MNRKYILFFCLSFLIFSPLARSENLESLKKSLRKSLSTRNVEEVQKNIMEMVSYGGKESMLVFLNYVKVFPAGEEKLYWLLINGATSFQDSQALEELKKFVIKYKRNSFARDLVFSLAHNPSPRIIPVLSEVLKNGTDDLRLMAVDQLSNIQRPETVDALLEAWKDLKKRGDRENTLKFRIIKALVNLTGESLGDLYESWESWWKNNRNKGLKPQESERRTGTVVDKMDLFRRSEYDDLRKMPKERILLIKGAKINYDHIEETLAKLQIPHRVIDNIEFNQTSFHLRGVMVILINCSDYEDFINPHGIQKLRDFTALGGYLFTEDWGMMGVIEKAWPKKLHSGKFLSQQTVGITPARGASSHPYLRGIFGFKKKERKDDSGNGSGRGTVARSTEEALKKVNQVWQIDEGAPYIRILSPEEVTILMVSEELRKVADGNGTVGLTFDVFPEGRPVTGSRTEIGRMQGGRVLHMMSHFGKQRSEDDAFTIQNIILNFIIEAKSRWDAHSKKQK